MARPIRYSSARLVAIAAMIGASALIAGTSLIAKALGSDASGAALHPLQVTAGRFFFALCALATIGAWLRPTLAGANWPLHAGRSIAGWLAVTCLFTAAARMPLADATAISFLSPLIAVFLAALVLRERVGPRRWAAVAIAVIGALILTRPGSEAFRPTALIALVSAMLMGLEMIFIKRLSDSEPPLRILLINNSIGAAIACTAAAVVWRSPGMEQWGLLVSLGLVMAAGQFCFIQAMKRAETSFISPVFYTSLIFAAVYDYLVFAVLPDGLSVFGAALIVIGVIMLAVLGGRPRPRVRMST